MVQERGYSGQGREWRMVRGTPLPWRPEMIHGRIDGGLGVICPYLSAFNAASDRTATLSQFTVPLYHEGAKDRLDPLDGQVHDALRPVVAN